MKKNLSKIFLVALMAASIAGCSSTPSKKPSSGGGFGGIFTSSKPQKAQHTDADYELDYTFFKEKGLPIPDNFKGRSVEYLVPGNDVLKEHGYSFFKKHNEKEMLKFFKDTTITGYGSNSNYWRWKITFTEQEFKNSVARNLPMVYKVRPRDVMTLSKGEWKSLPITAAAIGDVKDVEVAARGRSGVITYLLITTNKNKFLVSKELNVRKLLTADKNSTKINRTIPLYGTKGGANGYSAKALRNNITLLPSAYFSIEKGSGNVTLYGGGNGHGVGMPQWTAYDLTKNYNYSYKDVLKRYYPNTDMKNMYSMKGVDKNIRVGISNSNGGLDHTRVVLHSGGKLKITGSGFKIDVPVRQKIEVVNEGKKLSIKVNGKQRVKTVNPVVIEGTGYYITLDGIKKMHTTNPNYRGIMELKPSRTASRGIRIINEIYMEDYLKQVVPSEMPQSFGVEALKAQAIAARTYALSDYLKFRYKNDGFHVKDTTESQVYNNQVENDDAKEAIESTKGKVLMYKDTPVDAKYFSTSGGFTEAANYVW